MHLRSTTKVLALMLSILGTSCIPLMAIGDLPGVSTGELREKAPMKNLSAASVQVFKRPAKTFLAKTPLNPNNGKPTNPDSMISFVTTSHNMPITRRMKASEYYSLLNSNEQEFNKLGYSLYDKAESSVLLQEIPVDPIKLTNQKNSAPKSQGPKQSSDVRSQKFGPSSKTVIDVPKVTTTVQLAPGIIPQTLHHKEHKRWEFGDEKSFQAYLEVHASADGVFYGSSKPGEIVEKNHSNFHADGTVGASLLGANINLLSANADFICPEGNSSMTAKASVNVLGKTVWNLDESTKESWSKTGDYPKKTSWGVPFTVPVGPIAVKGEVGVTGTVGFRYSVALSRSGLSGMASPYANVTGYGEAGVDLLIAGAGVGAQITVCDAEVVLSNNMMLKWTNSTLKLQDDFSIDYDVHFLDGRLYAFAYVMVPNFSITHPFVEKRFEHNFFKWDGYRMDGNIVNVSQSLTVH